MTVRTRVELPTDTAETRRVHMAAFPGPEEADLVDALRRDSAFLPELSVVAVDDREVVIGHALLTRLRIGNGKGLALAPVAVAPEWQRKGVGTAVVRAALTAAAEAGERVVVVLGDPGYYGRFGFAPASGHRITGPFDVPDTYFQALPLPGADGVPHGACRYPAPFTEL
ncbi:GNAT family N-acetyltransferase [Kitasatospora sp. CB01950]|uniref:GNAT family N-acetyltransferase n=1 Tax=Kitasatospora sp. CB01950 TaxID=1703930 RepID=UPI0009388E6D|nr:N-acetyltransferase [Kitasatospora sp. CB01950]OKJ01087.1 acetyltransferase [Kitasatospora sp. CB01950]